MKVISKKIKKFPIAFSVQQHCIDTPRQILCAGELWAKIENDARESTEMKITQTLLLNAAYFALSPDQHRHNGTIWNACKIQTKKKLSISRLRCIAIRMRIKHQHQHRCAVTTHTYINQSRQTLIEAHDGKEKRNREMIVAFVQHQCRRKTLFNDFFLANVSLACVSSFQTEPYKLAWAMRLSLCVFVCGASANGWVSVWSFYAFEPPSVATYECIVVSHFYY